MKAISVDFWTDTLSNLESLSNSTGIPKNELIRRGAEIALLLYGVSEKETTQWLLGSLHSVEKILSKRPLDLQELRSEFSKSTALAAALTAEYITYLGREQPHVLKLYFRTMQQHLSVISQPNAKLGSSDIETVKEDIVTFANILSKLDEAIDLTGSLQPAILAKSRQQQGLHETRRPRGNSQRSSPIADDLDVPSHKTGSSSTTK